MPNVDRWVVQTALTALARGGVRLAPGRSLCINLSGQTLGDASFLEFVVDCLDRTGVSPERVCFEVTENSVITNIEHAKRFIGVLHGMGCRFALDDFGRGLSSFANLKSLALDYLKIDGSFIRNLASDNVNQAMVTAMIKMARSLKFQVIAEQVEDMSALDSVTRIGVDFVQGYQVGQATAARGGRLADPVAAHAAPATGVPSRDFDALLASIPTDRKYVRCGGLRRNATAFNGSLPSSRADAQQRLVSSLCRCVSSGASTFAGRAQRRIEADLVCPRGRKPASVVAGADVVSGRLQIAIDPLDALRVRQVVHLVADRAGARRIHRGGAGQPGRERQREREHAEGENATTLETRAACVDRRGQRKFPSDSSSQRVEGLLRGEHGGGTAAARIANC